MRKQTVFCDECVEEIPHDEAYWQDGRLFCGRCGGELEAGPAGRDLFEEMTTRKPRPLYSTDHDSDSDLEVEEDYEDYEEEE